MPDLPTDSLPPSFHLDAGRRTLRLSPRDPAFFGDPYPAYARLHAEAPVVFWEDLGLWCVASFEGVSRLLRDRRLGRERPGGYLADRVRTGDRSHLAAFYAVEACSLLEVEPPVHTRLRSLVNRAFVSRQVERLRPRIAALAQDLIERLPRDRPFDLVAHFAGPLPALVITEMMGLPANDARRLVDWSNAMVRMYMPAPSRSDALAADDAATRFAAYVRHHAGKRAAAPTDDLLGVLVEARADGDRLSEDELVSSAILLLNAGHEATVHQIGNAVAAVLSASQEPASLFASPAMTAVTVEESLRYDAPLHLFTRNAYDRVEIVPGTWIEPGDQVGLLLGAANRDPRAFAEPDRFDPLRGDQKTVAFGAGIHFCIGAPLARLELQVALSTLFTKLPGLRLAERPMRRDSWHFSGLERLLVEV